MYVYFPVIYAFKLKYKYYVKQKNYYRYLYYKIHYTYKFHIPVFLFTIKSLWFFLYLLLNPHQSTLSLALHFFLEHTVFPEIDIERNVSDLIKKNILEHSVFPEINTERNLHDLMKKKSFPEKDIERN